MPPVGAKVSALSTASERRTSPCQSPSYVLPDIHSAHQASVSSTEAYGWTGSGVGHQDGCQVSTNGTRWPADTSNSEKVAMSRPSSGAGVASQTESGPATATICPSTRRTHGTTRP